MCDRDIATNFDAVVREVILVDSCACTVIFLFAVIIIIIIIILKKKQNFCLRRYCSFTAAVQFKTDFLVELGIGFFFLKGNNVLNRTSDNH